MGLYNKGRKANEVQTNLLEHKPDSETANTQKPPDDNEGVPTDAGFSWIIAFCAFTIMSVIVGFNRCLSVLFVDISDEYQEKATTVSLMFTLHSLFGSIASIITSNIFMNKVTVRNICIAASIANTVTTICISQSPNIIIFLLLFTFKGFFFGVLLVAPISLIGFYFKKRRSLASSLATAGFCVAGIVFPPITEALRIQFGMRGTLLVVSAIELHMLACSLLLRPVESYKSVYKSRQRRKQLETEALRQLSPIYTGPGDITTSDNDITYSQKVEKTDNQNTEAEKLLHEIHNDIYRDRSHSDASYNKNREDDGSLVDISFTPGTSPTLSSHLRDLKEKAELTLQKSKRDILLERQKSHLSAISMTELAYIAPDSIEEADEAENDESKEKKNKKSVFSRVLSIFIDTSLFKIWTFRMMMVFVVFSVFSQYTIIYMPAICSTINISKADAALMLTISGVLDLVTRVITGFIGDFKFLSKPKLVSFSVFVVGTVCHCTRFFTTYTLFFVYAILVGVFNGVRQNFTPVMLMDYVGVLKMAKAYGLSSTVATLTLSINHPIVAALFDATKGFAIPLHFVGVMMYVGTVILALEPIFKKLDEKNMVSTGDGATVKQSSGKLLK